MIFGSKTKYLKNGYKRAPFCSLEGGRFVFTIFESKTKYLKNGCKGALFVVPILISADRLKREKNRKQNKNKNKHTKK